MNAAEFLKLIEKHPLPWCAALQDTFCGFNYAPAGLTHHESFMEYEPSQALADAAPAMAAAILEFLIWSHTSPASDLDTWRAAWLRHADALSAALPEELR